MIILCALLIVLAAILLIVSAQMLATIVILILVITTRKEVSQSMGNAQENHDRILGEVKALKSHVDDASTRISAKLDELTKAVNDVKAANPVVDFSDVDTAISATQSEVDALGAPPPTPAADTAPASADANPPAPADTTASTDSAATSTTN
jgi:uncharacterized protein YoxC